MLKNISESIAKATSVKIIYALFSEMRNPIAKMTPMITAKAIIPTVEKNSVTSLGYVVY